MGVSTPGGQQLGTYPGDDGGVATFADKVGLEVVQTWKMPLPLVAPQRQLDFTPDGDEER